MEIVPTCFRDGDPELFVDNRMLIDQCLVLTHFIEASDLL